MTTKYLTCAETAKVVRAELKAAFPGVKMSVRSSVYAGGASIWVTVPSWFPVEPVEKVAREYEGAWFDGMTDCKKYLGPVTVGGEQVYSGADFIFVKHDWQAA